MDRGCVLPALVGFCDYLTLQNALVFAPKLHPSLFTFSFSQPFSFSTSGEDIWQSSPLGTFSVLSSGGRVSESQNGRGWKGPLWVI